MIVQQAPPEITQLITLMQYLVNWDMTHPTNCHKLSYEHNLIFVSSQLYLKPLLVKGYDLSEATTIKRI